MRHAGALLTDLYQLTMAHAYHELEMDATAVFELFVRRLPSRRAFLLAAGLAQVVEYLETLRFTGEDLEFLEGLGIFPRSFLDRLGRVRFTGHLDALPEGTPFFANEPVLRVTAPLLEAQIVESRLMNIVHFQTLIASKAARCVFAAQGRSLVDFGMRRAHEADAALFAARAAYLAGFDATATVEAGQRFGIPLSGTMAHSYVEAHESEAAAFRNFVRTRPTAVTLLIDTYDTARAAMRVAALAQELLREGSVHGIDAVRIDSGDLGAQARIVRGILDAHGCAGVRIVLSGGLDEHAIGQLVGQNVPVDAFGVGTALDVSADAPALDMAYKLQAYAGKPRRKISPGKQTWPGAKQVFRSYEAADDRVHDRIALLGEETPGQPLIREVIREGRCSRTLPTLREIREYASGQMRGLPASLQALQGEGEGRVTVEISPGLRALAAGMDAEVH